MDDNNTVVILVVIFVSTSVCLSVCLSVTVMSLDGCIQGAEVISIGTEQYTRADLCFSLQETVFAMLVEITGWSGLFW